jgi:hypothetical protein
MLKVSLAVLTMFTLAALTSRAASYNFQTINNPGDLNFNQLLGINNEGVIAGYFGDGTVLPNKGYTWTKTGGFVSENFIPSVQTQVTAINNVLTSGTYNTAGFYIDTAGANHGFTQIGGVQTTVDNSATTAVPAFNQLLGLNDSDIAVGFYNDSAGNAHGYTYNVSTKVFTPVTLPASWGATSETATAINNGGWIAGFYTNPSGNVLGFLDENGTFVSLSAPKGNGTNTSFFGLNNKGEVVGSYVNASGTNGLVYNWLTNTWTTVDNPHQSFTPAFGVSGTTINGVNDLGQLVGFYSDGTHVNGMLATPVPEPGSLALLLLGSALTACAAVKRKRRN